MFCPHQYLLHPLETLPVLDKLLGAPDLALSSVHSLLSSMDIRSHANCCRSFVAVSNLILFWPIFAQLERSDGSWCIRFATGTKTTVDDCVLFSYTIKCSLMLFSVWRLNLSDSINFVTMRKRMIACLSNSFLSNHSQ